MMKNIIKNIKNFINSMSNSVIFLIVFTLVLGILSVCFQVKISSKIPEQVVVQSTGEISYSRFQHPFTEIGDRELIQTFYSLEEIKGIEFEFSCNSSEELNIIIEDADDSKNKVELIITAQEGYQYIPIELSSENNYYQITIQQKENFKEVILIRNTVDDKYTDGELYIDGNFQKSDIVFKVYGDSNLEQLWFLYVVVVAIACAVGVLVAKSNYKLENKFIISILILSILYNIFLPPQTIPDEGAHIESAYRFSNKLLQVDEPVKNSNLMMRESDLEMYQITRANTGANLQYIYDNFQVFSDSDQTVEVVARSVSHNPIIYGPTTIGITIARLLNLGMLPMLYIARYMNLLFFSLCVYTSLRIAPIGKNIIFGVALLPMSVQQASSFSYDALVNGLTILILAIVLSLMQDQESRKKRIVYTMFLITLLMILIQFKGGVYCFFVLLILGLAKWDRKKHLKLFMVGAGVCLIVVILFVALFLDEIVVFNTTLDAYRLETYEGNYTIKYLIANPGHYLESVIRTIRLDAVFWWRTMLCEGLGWLKIYMRRTTFWLYNLFIPLLILSEQKNEFRIKMSSRIIMIGIAIACSISVILAMGSVTPVSSELINGVQGRYFLPVLPVLLCAFGNVMKIKIEKFNVNIALITWVLQIVLLMDLMCKLFIRS